VTKADRLVKSDSGARDIITSSMPSTSYGHYTGYVEYVSSLILGAAATANDINGIVRP
jgi:hypothetical protein